ncbi:Fe-S oxidoreductase [Euzebya pacifica]|uniref:Fe-S oxidoreductase n=1 Tax=Euzebya pacifica TaxID=1608957 RepID=A0A346Y5E7_9ACTN|nr:(Fe-S)-binding protein [Euzebya pacifica]AXV09694.1 Fe-S oxidoreductase [Euzebya pacifica]
MDTIGIIRLVVGLALFAAAFAVAARRVKYLVDLVGVAQPMPSRIPGEGDGRPTFGHVLRYQVQHILAQQKILKWTTPGVLHAFIFWAFIVHQTLTLEALGEVFDPEFHIPFFGPGHWWTELLGFMQDFVGLLVLIAVVGFALIRFSQAPSRDGRESRFAGSNLAQGWYTLFFEFGLLYSVLILRGVRAAEGTLPYPDGAFVSSFVGGRLESLPHETLEIVGLVALLVHIAVFGGFLVFTLYSKHLHVLAIAPQVAFSRTPKALGKLEAEKIDIENMGEDDVLGVGQIEQFGFKRFLDYYSCTECGRCQSQCPAWNTAKPLSPKLLIMDLRDHLWETGPYLLDGGRENEKHADVDVLGMMLVGDEPGQSDAVIDFDVLWSCTTCGACVEECPVDIEHVDQIIDLRRYKAQMESSFPQEAGAMLRNIENSGDPWGAGAMKRLEWAQGMEIPVLGKDVESIADVDYLFWVGCAGAFEDRAKKTTVSTAQLLQAAGVSFAVLGEGEACTGDPARRLGMEYLFQMMADMNVETFKEAGADLGSPEQKGTRIITACPHCLNTLKNEYPDFGAHFEVIHHSEILAQLIVDGKLSPQRSSEGQRVTFHDPCYLGRHNEIYDEPRSLLSSVEGLETIEMQRSRNQGFCCGAGGAKFFMEEVGERVNLNRIDEAIATLGGSVDTSSVEDPGHAVAAGTASGASGVVAVACPFCKNMLDDGTNDRVSDGTLEEGAVQVLDVSQVLAMNFLPDPDPGDGAQEAADAPEPEPAH